MLWTMAECLCKIQKMAERWCMGKNFSYASIGRTRGGLNTKLHAIVDGLGNPIEFLISAGNDADSKHAID